MSVFYEDFPKFMALDEEKRERIINAAMHEFLGGYKKASTDVIVRGAGISKGLLFHYFGTKERLYNFLIDYGKEIIEREYLNLLNFKFNCIFDSLWQMSLLKRDLYMQYPDVFDFLVSAYVDDTPKMREIKNNLTGHMNMQTRIIEKIYQSADYSLFRDDVDTQLAMQIITWAIQGYSQSKVTIATGEKLGETAREHYDVFLDEFQKILDMLKQCFYK